MKTVTLPLYYKDILYTLADIELEGSNDKSDAAREKIVQRLAHELVSESLTPSLDMMGKNPSPRMSTPEEFYLLNPDLDKILKQNLQSVSDVEYKYAKRQLRNAITLITQVYLKTILHATLKQKEKNNPNIDDIATAQYAPLGSGSREGVKEHNRQADLFRYYRLFIGIAISSSLLPLFSLSRDKFQSFMRYQSFAPIHSISRGELRKNMTRKNFITKMSSAFSKFFSRLDILRAFEGEK